MNASNVTLDCNHFVVDGTGAGVSTDTAGIWTPPETVRVTVRHCDVRGFEMGMVMNGNGHTVEDNALSANTHRGIVTNGIGNVTRRNLIREVQRFATGYGYCAMAGHNSVIN